MGRGMTTGQVNGKMGSKGGKERREWREELQGRVTCEQPNKELHSHALKSIK
jgi:hypothetical protein